MRISSDLFCKGTKRFPVYYNPRNWIAIPDRKITAPAITLLYFSTGFRLILLSPSLKTSTMLIIVAIVTMENNNETNTAPPTLLWAAGYISMGINGSQGPNIKIRNSIHGVVLTTSVSCI